jgi:VanZ family protein
LTDRRWALPFAWAVCILILTSLPGSIFGGIHAPRDSDKLVHFILYGVLGLLAARAALSARPGMRVLIPLLCAILLLAMVDELHQHFIPGRSMDVHDWMADALGAAVGMALAVTRRDKERTA